MLANALTHGQKVTLLSLVEAEKQGLKHETALEIGRTLTGISKHYLSVVYVQLAMTHRLANSEVYYFNGHDMYFIGIYGSHLIDQEFFDDCMPMRREIIRQVRKSFKRRGLI